MARSAAVRAGEISHEPTFSRWMADPAYRYEPGVERMIGSGTIGSFIGIAAVVSVALAYTGTFYVTGRQWYEGCYELRVEQSKVGWAKPQAADAYKAALWAKCEPIVDRAMFASGLLYVGDPSRDLGAAALGSSCPSMWSDMPMVGMYHLAIDLVQTANAPTLLDRFTPAEWMVGRAVTSRWPSCSSERQRLGFPKIVEKSPGRFDWETPCIRCDTDTRK